MLKVDIATAELFSDFEDKRYYFCAQYCKDTFEDAPEKYRDTESTLPEATPVIAIDPICKMDVNTSTAELYSDYREKRYYFCAPYCKQTFDATPDEYENKDFRD